MLVSFKTSKSLSDESKYKKITNEMINFSRQVSVSFIDSIPKQVDDFMCFEENSDFSSSLSSSEASNFSSLDLLDNKALLDSLSEAHQVNMKENEQSEQKATLGEQINENKIEVRTKKDLTELKEKYKVYSNKNSKRKRRVKKTKRNVNQNSTDMKSELCTYKVRRSSAHLFNLFISNGDEELHDEPYEDEIISTSHANTDSNNYFTHHVKLFIQNMEIAHESDLLNYDSRKAKQHNEKLKLKKLVKSGDVLSLTKENSKFSLDSFVKLNKNSLRKGECNLHVKYNVYKKIFYKLNDSYISITQRCFHTYKLSNKKISLEEFNAFKANFRANEKLDKLESLAAKHAQDIIYVDPTTVVNNSLDHQNVNELNQVYDDLYIEFLISLQHREITPEDYEYLSRLDELIKKKTVNDALLNKFKSEHVNQKLLEQLNGEVCGICLESYVLDQNIKHLPCKHTFHSDCIDQWLKNQSHCCPLDNMSVEISENQMNSDMSSHIPNEDASLCIEVNDLLQNMINMVEQENA